MITEVFDVPARMSVTFNEMTRLTGDFYIELPFMKNKWVKVTKSNLFNLLREEVITNTKYDIYDTGEEIYVYGFAYSGE